jgi:hypothetical protein
MYIEEPFYFQNTVSNRMNKQMLHLYGDPS